MTKEEFEVLHLDMQQSGKPVKDYLHEAGVRYSTYNYWRKKLLSSKSTPEAGLAPISFTRHADSTSVRDKKVGLHRNDVIPASCRASRRSSK